MLISERDELLIQRCVDDELSSSETQALLKRLDQLDGGWKTLACGLLEDRGLRKMLSPQSVAASATLNPVTASSSLVQNVQNSVPASTATPMPRVSGERAREVVRHWWSHPVTSLTLCAAIAFVGGMLIPDFTPDQRPMASNAPGPGSFNPGFPRAQTASNGPQSYQFQMPGANPVQIPVYSGVNDLLESDRRHPLFAEPENSQEPIRWIVVPAGENKSMLVPVSEDPDLVIQ
ncbi:MAG: hypothetical protein JNM43_14200 [Planctomycetaceae bacterium]|nr:hypothetical protein [Planctomycetaceae bacterium]